MISWCATRAMKAAFPSQIISIVPSLHQLDVKGDGTGVFQAGWDFASIHHFRSWFSFFPRTHPYALHDENATMKLIGFIARAIGPSNWGRRFVWGLDEAGDQQVKASSTPASKSLVVCLGFSVTKYKVGLIDQSALERVVRSNLSLHPSENVHRLI